jgi:hypothetical protein
MRAQGDQMIPGRTKRGCARRFCVRHHRRGLDGGEASQGKDAMEDFACLVVQGDPTFIMELAEWDMERPLVSPQVTQGVSVQAEAFADPNAGGANQEEGVGEEIVGLA